MEPFQLSVLAGQIREYDYGAGKVDKVPDVTCIASSNKDFSRYAVGFSDGMALLYEAKFDSGKGLLEFKKMAIDAESGTATTRKSIQSICHQNDDGILSLHAIGNLKLKKVILNKGCMGVHGHSGRPIYLSSKALSFFAWKKKSLCFFSLEADRASVMEELPIEGISCLSSFGDKICFATESQYQLMHIQTKVITPLFAFDPLISRPLIVSLKEFGFLVVLGTSPAHALGLIVNLDGEPAQGTLEFSSFPRSLVYSSSHLISLSDELIEIYSIKDLAIVQSIHAPMMFGGASVAHCTGDRVLLFYGVAAFELGETPIELKIESLIEMGKIEDASNLLESKEFLEKVKVSEKLTIKKAQFHGMIFEVLLKQHSMSKAIDHMKNSHISPDLVIYATNPKFDLCLVLPKRQSNLAVTLNLLSQEDQEKLILPYLEYCRTVDVYSHLQTIIEDNLLRFYVERDDKIGIFRIIKSSNCTFSYCYSVLESKSLYYPMFVLCKQFREYEIACKIWKRFLNGEIRDTGFGTFKDFIEYLKSADEPDLMVKHLEWIFSQDPDIGLELVTRSKKLLLIHQDVEPIICKYGFECTRKYYEFLLREEENTSFIGLEAYRGICSRYALTFVGELHKNVKFLTVSNREKEYQETNANVHKTFIDFLRSKKGHSDACRVSFYKALQLYHKSIDLLSLLSEIEKSFPGALLFEKSIISKYMGNKKAALDILLSLKDFKSVEILVDEISVADEQQPLLNHLLVYYLQGSNSVPLEITKAFLEKYSSRLDNLKVIDAIPETWAVAYAAPYINKAFSMGKASSDQTLMQLKLYESYKEQLQLKQLEKRRQKVVVSTMK